MSGIVYTGSADYQSYGPGDLAKAGVEEFEETSFPQGVAVEVPDEAAKAIVDNETGIFAQFEYLDVEEEEDESLEPEPEPSIYADQDYNDLKKEVASRNEEREDEDHITPASMSKVDLIAALDADDVTAAERLAGEDDGEGDD